MKNKVSTDKPSKYRMNRDFSIVNSCNNLVIFFFFLGKTDLAKYVHEEGQKCSSFYEYYYFEYYHLG